VINGGYSTNFDARAIADSGQVFRAEITADGVRFVSGNEMAVVAADGKISSTNDDYFRVYFDLATDYGSIENGLTLPAKIVAACRGIRILNADPAEIIVSFIISANNNIKRIKNTVAKICEKHGERRHFDGTSYFAFPTLSALGKITAAEFAAFGCGYRAPYLVKTIGALQGADFARWRELNNDELYKRLIGLAGVGDKVARCIMLFAFHRLDIVPVDTWIIKNAGRFIDVRGKTPKTAAVELQKHFGAFGGIAQQYIFYYTQFLKQTI
jgi:N-glycosylase/DNA lyase